MATLYVSFMRGTPILIKLFLVYYGLPELLKPIGIDLSRTDPLLFVIVTYALSDAASFAEIFRGAVRSVDKGQTEAAYAAGMTTFQSFRRIVVPQALIVAFPNMANTLIGSLKDTSLDSPMQNADSSVMNARGLYTNRQFEPNALKRIAG
ncbi:ABC transporter permease subunit [Paenibacillus polymyxa]|uniref:ABC transporter permease subunit n=1 Tax=Paenibacillus polymyxa TaxID=1406 RepID=UPI00288A865B|nr:ABC transporter permease subunit [Paenibacillus polymyxa]